MTTKNIQDPPARPLPAWLESLLAEDAKTQGRHTLDEPTRAQALADLTRLLVDWRWLDVYIRHLSQRFHARFLRPKSRLDGGDWKKTQALALLTSFPHKQLLSHERVKVIAKIGPAALRNDSDPSELPRLLLNPFALWDLADWINETMPDAWLDLMSEIGKEYRELYEAHDKPPAPTPAFTTVLPTPSQQLPPTVTGGVLQVFKMNRDLSQSRVSQGTVRKDSDSWEIKYTAEMGAEAAALIERITGDHVAVVTLTLRQHTLDEKHVAFSLGCAPPPSLEPVKIVVEFANQQKREFTLEVPPFPMEFDETMPCESLPIDAVPREGRADLEASQEAWLLQVRSAGAIHDATPWKARESFGQDPSRGIAVSVGICTMSYAESVSHSVSYAVSSF